MKNVTAYKILEGPNDFRRLSKKGEFSSFLAMNRETNVVCRFNVKNHSAFDYRDYPNCVEYRGKVEDIDGIPCEDYTMFSVTYNYYTTKGYGYILAGGAYGETD